MKWEDLSDFQKKNYKIIGGMVLLYLYLVFFVEKTNITDFFFHFMRAIIPAITLQWSQIAPDVRAVVYDIFLLMFGMWFWVFFFSQFALPTVTIGERQQVFNRIFNYLGENIGPAIFIQNGQVIARKQEQKRRGPGVLLIDSASAVLLHNQTTHTRAVGPGLTFTRRSERIYNTVDLRTQIRRLGPKPDDIIFPDEDMELIEEFDEYEFEAAQERRLQTSGLTRDAIEIVPNIKVVFKLDADPGEGGSRFGFRPESVIKAIRHEAIATGTSNRDNPDVVTWDWLPAHLAANLWREYLRKYTINELFDITKHEVNYPGGDQQNPSATVFDHIVSMINARLKNPEVVMLNDVGETVPNQFEPSREYALLKEHGLKVFSASVENLNLQDENRLVERWKATWLKRATKEETNIKKFHEVIIQKAAEDAVMNFADNATAALYQEILTAAKNKKSTPDNARSLYTLMRATRTYIVRDSNYNRELVDHRVSLDSLIDWVQDQQNGAR